MLEGLKNEHESTKYILNLLNMAVARWEQGESIRIELFLRGAAILQKYAEDFHQHLEEELLFPIMEHDGVPWCGGPLEVLQKEHKESRQYLVDLQKALGQIGSGEVTNKEEIIENIRAFSLLLQAHMDKEEMIVFPIAERLLQESDMLQGDFTKMAAQSHWLKDYGAFMLELERELGIEDRRSMLLKSEQQTEAPDRLAEEFLNDRRNQ